MKPALTGSRISWGAMRVSAISLSSASWAAAASAPRPAAAGASRLPLTISTLGVARDAGERLAGDAREELGGVALDVASPRATGSPGG